MLVRSACIYRHVSILYISNMAHDSAVTKIQQTKNESSNKDFMTIRNVRYEQLHQLETHRSRLLNPVNVFINMARVVLRVGRSEPEEHIDDTLVSHRRDIAQVAIVHRDLAQHTAHDLARACLRQPRRFLYEVGLRERPDLLAHCSNNLMYIIQVVF